jgi:hypothetical protein
MSQMAILMLLSLGQLGSSKALQRTARIFNAPLPQK